MNSSNTTTFMDDSVNWIWTYDQRIPSNPECGVQTIHELLAQLEKNDWPSKAVFGIHMAMEEAVMNAIKHGNQRDPSKHVHVVMSLSDDRFYAQITDQGEGFDPVDVPDPTLDENLEKASGRGLMLMNNFVDLVKYNSVGNSVELVKHKMMTD